MKTQLLLFIVLLSASVATYAQDMNGGHMGSEDRMMSYGGGLLIWLTIVVLAAIVIYVVLQLARSRRQDGSSGETPLDILKKRYARGEITREEFEEKKRHLVG